MRIRRDNRLFELARRGKRLPHVVVAFMVSLLVIFLSPGGIVLLLFLRLNESTPLGSTMALILPFGGIVLLLFPWVRWYEKRPFWTLGFEAARAGAKFFAGVAIAIAMYSLMVFVLLLTGQIADAAPSEGQTVGLAALGGVGLILLGWIVQGSAEETLVRGYLMQVVGARHAPWLGVIVQAVFFSLVHGLNPGALGVMPLLNLFLAALMFACYALWEGGLWGVCGFHAAWNWVQGNVYGLSVSGMPLPFSVLNLRPSTGHKDWLTGGVFGPEASVVSTILMLVAASVFFWLLQRKQSRA